MQSLANCGLPAFQFAGFQWPRYAVNLPTGDLRQRLAHRKTRCTGDRYHSPAPDAQGRGFYLQSTNAAGLRWQWCDDVCSSIRHTGWFADEYGGTKIRGIVLRLPHSRGFLAGWSMGEGMASSFDYSIFPDEESAAQCADSMAENAAESERDREERYLAMGRAETAAIDARGELRDCIALCRADRRTRDDVSEAIETMYRARREYREAREAYEGA